MEQENKKVSCICHNKVDIITNKIFFFQGVYYKNQQLTILIFALAR